MDYRDLNKVTIKECYPFPEVNEEIFLLKGSNWFSQIDLNQGYYQIPVAKEDQHKTAFVTNDGYYEFTRMPFGLTNAPRIFQKCMKQILGHLPYIKIFLDDILIHSISKEEHVQHIKELLDICQTNHVSINFEKSNFCRREIKYLGHIINQNGIKADISRVSAMEKLGKPQTRKQLQKLVGFVNWFRPYVQNLSTLLHPITKLLKQNRQVIWKEPQTQALKQIFEKIKENIQLAHPDPNKPFTLFTDASIIGIGAILIQWDKVIGVYSHKLTGSEKNYTTMECETYAIIRAVLYFKKIMYGSRIIIKTDNVNLIHQKPIESNRTQR